MRGAGLLKTGAGVSRAWQLRLTFAIYAARTRRRRGVQKITPFDQSFHKCIHCCSSSIKCAHVRSHARSCQLLVPSPSHAVRRVVNVHAFVATPSVTDSLARIIAISTHTSPYNDAKLNLYSPVGRRRSHLQQSTAGCSTYKLCLRCSGVQCAIWD